MQTNVFNERYRELNKEQREAVDTIEGPVMVIAGPGTGKTQILTLRIAKILLVTQVEPENILALTFTDSAVSSMRTRLFQIVGTRAYRTPIHTFHSFSNDIIKRYPEYFPRIVGSQNITEVDQIQIINSLIEKGEYDVLKPAGDSTYYVKEILRAINELKREAVSAKIFDKMVREERFDFENKSNKFHEKGIHQGKMKGEFLKQKKIIEKNEELSIIYQLYEAYLSSERLYDFNDMIVEAYEALQNNSDLLRLLQEEFQYILVDEHQDTNNAQNKILTLLMNFYQNPNIFIVGDEKQAIFRFQGASLENFFYFKTIYPNAKEIILIENYRSTQTILDSAHHVMMSRTKESFLRAQKGKIEKPIEVIACTDPEQECFFVAHDIDKKIKRGISPEEMVILCRDNKDMEPFAHALRKRGLLVALQGDTDVLMDLEIRKLITILKAINEFGADDIFFEALHVDFLDISPLDIYRLADYARRLRINVFSAIKEISNDKKEFNNFETIQKIINLFEKLAKEARNENFLDFLERVARETGFLSHILSLPNSIEKLEAFSVFFEAIRTYSARKDFFTISDFFSFLKTTQTHGIRIPRSLSSFAGDKGKIRIMTAHRAKGMEFGEVYIVRGIEGRWGNRFHREALPLIPRVYSFFNASFSRDQNEDERNIFYVAVTRAKHHLTITYPKNTEEGKIALPSQFINEIKKELIHFSHSEKTIENIGENFSLTQEKLKNNIEEKEFISRMFSEREFSVTALNNYLECPWKYFYLNLFRFPQKKEFPQMYGSAIHAALRDFFNDIKHGREKKKTLISAFELHLNKEPIAKVERQRALMRGKKALSGFYDFSKSLWKTRFITELEIHGINISKDIFLTGKIDKIEFIDDGKEVNVIDYKTGRPKTQKEIEGLAGDKRGNIKRQLVFYKLLLNQYKDHAFVMKTGEIQFVEPDEKGKYHREIFFISDEEVADLIKIIKKTAEEIRSLSFWEKYCQNQECSFCALRKMMKKRSVSS